MRKHTFLRAKKFLRRRAENAVFGGSFRQRRQKIPIPPAGKSALFSGVSRACFTAENPREKIGWQRRFFTRFSGKIHAVFFIIIYRDSMVRNCPRGRMICRSRLPLCSEGADRHFGCAETAVRRRAHSASAGNTDAVGGGRRFHRTAKQSFACTRRMYRVFCTPLVVVFPCGTRCRGAGMFHMKHSRISQRRDAVLPSRNVSCETFYPTQM